MIINVPKNIFFILFSVIFNIKKNVDIFVFFPIGLPLLDLLVFVEGLDSLELVLRVMAATARVASLKNGKILHLSRFIRI